MVALAAVAAIKLALLGAYGPIFTADSPGYVGYAARMLASTDWLHDAELASGPFPTLAYRMLGYPALIAVVRQIAGAPWPYVLVPVQIAASSVAGWAVYRLAVRLGVPDLLAIAAVAAVLMSVQLILDLCILTDSLHASLLVLAVCVLADGGAGKPALGVGRALAAGLLLVLAFLLREAIQIMVVALLPVVAVRVWLAGRALWMRSALACLLVLAPLTAAAEIYKAWNFHRSGERFITTVATLTIMDALARAAEYDPTVFAGDTMFDRIAKNQFKKFEFSEAIAFNAAMFAAGFKPTEVSRLAYARYLTLWRTQPRTMLRVPQLYISERIAKLGIRPIGSICDAIEWATGKPPCHDFRELFRAFPSGLARVGWSTSAVFLARLVEQTLSIVLFLGFLIGVPIHLAMRVTTLGAAVDRTALTIGAFWLMYLAWLAAYAIVHLEDRYLMPVIPFANLAGCYVWRDLVLRVARMRQLTPRAARRSSTDRP